MPDLLSPLLNALILAADAPAGGAAAGGSEQAESGGFVQMLPVFAIIFFIFYFLVIRPQGKEKRKREDLLKQVKKHDRVVTTAGIHGIVVSTTDAEIVLEVSDGVRIKFDRAAIWQVKGDDNSPSGSPAQANPVAEPAGKGKGKS